METQIDKNTSDSAIEDDGTHIIHQTKYQDPYSLPLGTLIETLCGRTTPWLGEYQPSMSPVCSECAARYPFQPFWS